MRRKFMTTEGKASAYMYVEALEDGLSVSISKNAEYQIDDGVWTSLSSGTYTQSVSKGSKIYFKATSGSGAKFTLTKGCNIGGNIMSMLYGDEAVGKTSLLGYDYAFEDMMYGQKNIKDASKLIMPATTLSLRCYDGMFSNCTSLVNAPKLPATTLAEGCYSYMFSSCTSLVNAPALPATTLAKSCYSAMFYNCTSLVNAPALPATTLAGSCYQSMFESCTSLVNALKLHATTLAESCCRYMFSSCTSLVNAPELPATTLAEWCYGHMFQGCTSLVNAPALPATTLVYACYAQMFQDCTALKTAPVLPATTLAQYCYSGMFRYCSSLNYIKAMFTTTPSTSYTDVWVQGVASTGTFVKSSNATWSIFTTYAIPPGWTATTA